MNKPTNVRVIWGNKKTRKHKTEAISGQDTSFGQIRIMNKRTKERLLVFLLVLFPHENLRKASAACKKT
jgi:hypothetical protein